MDETASSSPGNGSPRPAERRVRHGLIEDWRDAVGILLLLLVAAFFGAMITRYWPAGDEEVAQSPTDITARVAGIEARLAKEKGADFVALKDRVAKLETRLRNAEIQITAGNVAGSLAATAFGAVPTPGTGPSPAGAVPVPQTALAANKALDDLGARLTALEAKIGTTPDDVKTLSTNVTDIGAKIDGFTARLAKIEDSDLLEMARRASFATAIANLTRAAQGSAPFKAEYDVVAAMAPNDTRIADIAPIAATGLPTASTLMASFIDVAYAVKNAERLANSNGWWAQLWANFMSLVSSRTVGETGDDTAEGRVARAEVRLKAGDLRAAVRELESVEGPASAPLKPWLAEASARIKLETELADLNTRAVEALQAPTTTAADPAAPVPQMPEP
jgi:hypothetical protein